VAIPIFEGLRSLPVTFPVGGGVGQGANILRGH
jgi:hypothetical protein